MKNARFCIVFFLIGVFIHSKMVVKTNPNTISKPICNINFQPKIINTTNANFIPEP